MKKLPLHIKRAKVLLGNEEKCKELKGLKKVFHTCTFDDVKLTNKIVKSIKDHIKNVKFIEFIETEMSEAGFKSILKLSEKVEKLVLVDSFFFGDNKKNTNNIPTFVLPKLKSLVLLNSEWNILKYFGETNISELKLKQEDLDNEKSEVLKNFLKSQKKLTSIAISIQDSTFYTIIGNDPEIYDFKLEKVSINFKYWGIDTNCDQNLINFLTNHLETLKYLEMEKKLSEQIYDFIFSKLKVNTLIINSSFLPSTSLSYSSKRQNIFLQKLVLNGQMKSNVAAQGLFHIYRNIKCLTIENWINEIIDDSLISIASSLRNLEDLSIPFLEEIPPELPILSLKYLHIESIQDSTAFQTFAMNQNNLEWISLKWIHVDITNILDELTSHLSNLERVTFGPCAGNVTLRNLESMKNNCPKLCKIELFRSYGEEFSTMEGLNDYIENNSSGPKLKIYQLSPDASSTVFKSEKSMWTDERSSYYLDDGTDDSSDNEEVDSFGDIDDDDDMFDDYDGYFDSDDSDRYMMMNYENEYLSD